MLTFRESGENGVTLLPLAFIHIKKKIIVKTIKKRGLHFQSPALKNCYSTKEKKVFFIFF